ncbi:rpr [Drosophila busckii]|uniref:Rpr n=1 Tax=Drosophila busckii TaxID=30019 RepID=A0A0M3QX04_DROBS|nr:cell death protein rpr [Drosophila busckii]ALC45019.1 rpr [Drosophila busckii]
MAVAFYIPDQATLLRKAQEQEKQLLRLRQWQMATVMLNTIRQLMDSNSLTSQCLQRAGRKCCKWRKPSQ